MGATFPQKLAAALAGLSVLLGAAVCSADDAQELELAKNRFNAGQYDEAHQYFARLLDPGLPPCEKGPGGGCRITDADLVERTRVLDAAALIALTRPALADAQIEKVLRQNPAYAPSPALFPQEVVDRFTEVRGRLREELEKLAAEQAHLTMQRRIADQQAREAQERWIADLQRLAGQEKRIEVNSRWVAMLPFGVGQYQNGDARLGALFTVSEALLGASVVTTAALAQHYASVDRSKCDSGCLLDTANKFADAALVNRISFGALAAIVVTGVVQAQVAFVPEKITLVPRTVPARPKIAPTFSLAPGNVGVGLVGTF